jgi:hypothetical protein
VTRFGRIGAIPLKRSTVHNRPSRTFVGLSGRLWLTASGGIRDGRRHRPRALPEVVAASTHRAEGEPQASGAPSEAGSSRSSPEILMTDSRRSSRRGCRRPGAVKRDSLRGSRCHCRVSKSASKWWHFVVRDEDQTAVPPDECYGTPLRGRMRSVWTENLCRRMVAWWRYQATERLERAVRPSRPIARRPVHEEHLLWVGAH